MDTCSLGDDRIHPTTHKFESDCNQTTFCSPDTATCLPKACRRDEFPFGYLPGASIPPLCSRGTFCPDQGDKCRPLLPVGSSCQLNRDEQCQPPPEYPILANQDNTNGSLCLASTCTFANATLGQPCVIDNVTYVGYSPSGQQAAYSIARDNCVRPALYCEPDHASCFATNAVGLPCATDNECYSFTCGDAGHCVDPPELPDKISKWEYVVSSLAMITGMLVFCAILVILHKRQRMQHRVEVAEYSKEQTEYQNAINSLIRDAAGMCSLSEGTGDDDDAEFDYEDRRPLLVQQDASWKFRRE